MVNWIAYNKFLSEKILAKKKVLLAVILLISTIFIGVAIAAYTMNSNQVTVIVTNPTPSPSPSPTPPPEATLTLSTSASHIITGQSITLTATTSDHSNGVVNFLNSGNNVGSITTTNGVASITFQLTIEGSYSFTASMIHS